MKKLPVIVDALDGDGVIDSIKTLFTAESAHATMCAQTPVVVAAADA